MEYGHSWACKSDMGKCSFWGLTLNLFGFGTQFTTKNVFETSLPTPVFTRGCQI